MLWYEQLISGHYVQDQAKAISFIPSTVNDVDSCHIRQLTKTEATGTRRICVTVHSHRRVRGCYLECLTNRLVQLIVRDAGPELWSYSYHT